MGKKPFILVTVSIAGLFILAAGYMLVHSQYIPREKAAAPSRTEPEASAGTQQPIATDAAPSQKQKGNHEKQKSPSERLGNDPHWLKTAEAALNDPQLHVRVETVLALRDKLTRESVELLARFLRDGSGVVVNEALDALGYIGLNSDLKRFVYEILAEMASDRTYLFRGQALLTATMLSEDDRILAVVSDFVSAGDDMEKLLAARSMSFIASPACLPLIKELLALTDDPAVQRSAVNTLARIDNPETLEMIQELLLTGDPTLQKSCAWALSRSANDEYQKILSTAVAGGDIAGDSLDLLAASPAAAAIFGDLLGSADIPKDEKIEWINGLGRNAASAAGSTRKEISALLGESLQDETDDLEIQAALLEALAQVGPTQDQTELIEANLDSDSFLVQGAALNTYLALCSPDNYKKLLDLYWDDDPQIRRTAFFFSEQFLNKSDLEALEKATQHSDEFISKHSKKLIAYIQGNP